MKMLDLHGIRHEFVVGMVIRFVEDLIGVPSQIEIVTGHSERMRSLVIEVLDQYELDYLVGGSFGVNMAVILVD